MKVARKGQHHLIIFHVTEGVLSLMQQRARFELSEGFIFSISELILAVASEIDPFELCFPIFISDRVDLGFVIETVLGLIGLEHGTYGPEILYFGFFKGCETIGIFDKGINSSLSQVIYYSHIPIHHASHQRRIIEFTCPSREISSFHV